MRRFLERLNTPVAVAIVLVLFLVVDGCLFYRYNLRSQPAGSTTILSSTFQADLDRAVEEITLSSPEEASDTQQDSLTATLLLITLLIIGVINVTISLLTLLSARRPPKAGENHAGYLAGGRQPLNREAWNSETQPQAHKLEEEVLKLQQEYKQLAEELARVRILYEEAERERETILKGLQNIQQILQRKVATPSEEEDHQSKRSPRAQEEGSI